MPNILQVLMYVIYYKQQAQEATESSFCSGCSNYFLHFTATKACNFVTNYLQESSDYSGMFPDSFHHLLFPRLCQHNRRMPSITTNYQNILSIIIHILIKSFLVVFFYVHWCVFIIVRIKRKPLKILKEKKWVEPRN